MEHDEAMKKLAKETIEQITDCKRWHNTGKAPIEAKIRENQRRLEEMASRYIDAQRTLEQKTKKLQLTLKAAKSEKLLKVKTEVT